MSTKNTEMAVANENTGFMVLKENNLADIISEEMAGLNVAFERVKIPAGGGLAYELPGDDTDNPDTVKEFSAVILYNHPLNAYYKTKYTGGSNPPDCGSFDGVHGSGDPGGECAKCPFNVFGTGENGSKACKNKRRLYLLREGEIFPIILTLPTGSLKDFTRYMVSLVGKGIRPSQVVTRFSLKRAVSKSTLTYSQAQFAVDRRLTPEECKLVAALAEQVKALSTQVGYEEEEEPEDKDNPFIVDPETGEILEPLT